MVLTSASSRTTQHAELVPERNVFQLESGSKTDDRATNSVVSISSVRARRLWSLRKPHLLRSFDIYGRHSFARTGVNTPGTMFPKLLVRGDDDLPARPLRPPALCFHQVCEDVIYARQVAFAFGLQPIENSRIEAHAYRHLPPDVPQSHHACQLVIGKAWDVFEIKTRFVSGRLALGGAAECPPLLFSPSPVPDIFGSHAFQPYGPI